MEARKFWGLVIIAVLIVALISAVYITTWGFGQRQEVQQTGAGQVTNNYKLTEAEMAGVNYVNFNFTSNTSGVDVSFQNGSGNLYDITVVRDNDTQEPTVTYTRDGDVLNVNVAMDSGSATVLLGNSATYNGTFTSKIVGFSLSLGNNSKIDNLTSNIKYVGGGLVVINDTSFNTLNLNANVGGFQIQAEKPTIRTTNASVFTNIQIGGITVQATSQDNLGIKLNNVVDLGGISIPNEGFEILQNSTTIANIQTAGFAGKTNKLEINSNVGLGGININTFFFPA